jgi:glyoxylase-like metal-dependent hydrolase (beta-lactamase superfamily II)
MVTVLADGVWWVDLPGTNVYLVADGDSLTLVDAGMPWTDGTVARAIDKIGGEGSVDRVLVTHFDFDHVGGLETIRGLDAPVYVGTADAGYLRGEERPSWTNRKGALQRATDWLHSTPDLPVRAVDDGETVGSFTAYHTPGHTPGHTAFVSKELSVGLVGDLIWATGDGFELPPWYLAYDHDQARESLVAFADRAPDFGIVCQGHGTPAVTGGAERIRGVATRTRVDAGADSGAHSGSDSGSGPGPGTENDPSAP